MRGLLADCRHAFKIFLGNASASMFALLALVVAMAFVSAFLSLYVDLILRPHQGFERGGRIVSLNQTDGVAHLGISLTLIEQINNEVGALDGMAGIARSFPALSAGLDGEPVSIAPVTREFFSRIRPRLVLGRGFEHVDHESGAEPVLVISYAYWQDVFGGRPDVVGQTIDLRDTRDLSGVTSEAPPAATTFRVIGVMSPELATVERQDVNLWAPYERMVTLFIDNVEWARLNRIFWGIGLLGRGVSARAVLRELNTRFSGEVGRDLRIRTGFYIDGVEGFSFDVDLQREARRQVTLFVASSILLALAAASNVSLFLLAQAPGRRRELGIRMAVGATLRRLARQFITEAGLLIALAVVIGAILSVWLNSYLRYFLRIQGVEWHAVPLLDWRTLGLVGIVVALLTFLVALAPIQGLRRAGIAASSRQVAARATLAQRIVGTTQVAVTCTLGGAALAVAWYLGSMMLSDPGYETRNLYVARMSSSGLPTTPEGIVVEMSRRRDEIMGLTGVTDVAFGTLLPGPGSLPSIGRIQPADSSNPLELAVEEIDSRFIDLLGLDLLYGRKPLDGEVDAMLVNRTLARQMWGRDDVVGETLPFSMQRGGIQAETGDDTPIIGVIEDVAFAHPHSGVPPTVFSTGAGGTVSPLALIESSLGLRALEESLVQLIDSGSLEVTLRAVDAVSDLRSEILADDRARAFLAIAAAACVIVITVFSAYSMQRYLVLAGRREYAIRAALGAGPRSLCGLVLIRGLMVGLPGLLVGIPLTLIVVAWLQEHFISRDVQPILVALIVVVLLGSLLVLVNLRQARRVRYIRPARLLRED